MVFNGHTEEYIDEIDEELFAEIQVMYADGLLGNKGIFDALTPITTAIFNYLRGSNSQPYKADQIFPWISDYQKNPEFDEDESLAPSNGLIGFISQAKQFKIDRFKNARI